MHPVTAIQGLLHSIYARINPVFLRERRLLKKSERFSRKELDALKLARLKAICVHAYETCDYYHDLFREHRLDPHRLGHPGELSVLPFLTKDIVQRILNAWNRWSRDRLLAPNSRTLRYLFRAMNVPFRILHRIHRLRQSAPWIHSGDWPGNDTTWRTCLDLNQIIFYADKQGNFTDQVQRRYFSLVDGIVAGEGNGPLEPDPKTIGLIACGFEPVPVDYVCAWQMGIDPDRLKLYSQCRNHPLFAFDPSNLTVVCENNGTQTDFRMLNFHFMPPPAWKGSVERQQ